MEKDITPVERFYQDVADALGIESNYQYNPYTVGGAFRTRWNNRKPGNGRFEGFGLIRYFGPNCIHVSLHKPLVINKVFDSAEELLALLKRVD